MSLFEMVTLRVGLTGHWVPGYLAEHPSGCVCEGVSG